MSNNKIFKNQNRNNQENYTKYDPQYKLKNITPENVKFKEVESSRAVNLNTRMNKSYNTNLPSVGNVQETWHSPEIENDLENEKIDLNRPMIDNNDYFSNDSMGNNSDNVDLSILSEVQENKYILIVKGVVVEIGTKITIENELKKVVYGEHPLFKNVELDPTDVLVFKRLEIKIGVFLEG